MRALKFQTHFQQKQFGQIKNKNDKHLNKKIKRYWGFHTPEAVQLRAISVFYNE